MQYIRYCLVVLLLAVTAIHAENTLRAGELLFIL